MKGYLAFKQRTDRRTRCRTGPKFEVKRLIQTLKHLKHNELKPISFLMKITEWLIACSS